jgi:hypothetical protein
MKTKRLIYIALLCTTVYACKDETVEPTQPKNPTPAKKSQLSLIANEWVLKETFEDDVQKTTDGTGRYLFNENGTFMFLEQGNWKQLGNFVFNDLDSNSLTVSFSFGGSTVSYWWDIKKLTETNYNVEFTAGGKKNNYNYTR